MLWSALNGVNGKIEQRLTVWSEVEMYVHTIYSVFEWHGELGFMEVFFWKLLKVWELKIESSILIVAYITVLNFLPGYCL